MVDEENNSNPGDPPFERAWWTDENWFILNDDGKMRGISLPAVHEDGLISWRWRED
jgi:hypothetical protein